MENANAPNNQAQPPPPQANNAPGGITAAATKNQAEYDHLITRQVPLLIENDEYVLSERIGSGGQAKVFKGHVVNRPDDVYAIKLLKRDESTKIHQSCLEKEVEYLRRIKNRYIIEFRAANLHLKVDNDEYLAIVIEYCDGNSMHQHLLATGASCYSEHEALRYTVHILVALRALHVNRISHRDISPKNVVLKNNPLAQGGTIAKLIDFGMCEDMDQERLARGCQGVIFMRAPEVVNYRNTRVRYDGVKADMYSLGMLMYWMVTGAVPLVLGEPQSVNNQILRGQAQDAPEIKNVSWHYNYLVKGLLRADAKQRYSMRKCYRGLKIVIQKQMHPDMHILLSEIKTVGERVSSIDSNANDDLIYRSVFWEDEQLQQSAILVNPSDCQSLVNMVNIVPNNVAACDSNEEYVINEQEIQADNLRDVDKNKSALVAEGISLCDIVQNTNFGIRVPSIRAFLRIASMCLTAFDASISADANAQVIYCCALSVFYTLFSTQNAQYGDYHADEKVRRLLQVMSDLLQDTEAKLCQTRAQFGTLKSAWRDQDLCAEQTASANAEIMHALKIVELRVHVHDMWARIKCDALPIEEPLRTHWVNLLRAAMEVLYIENCGANAYKHFEGNEFDRLRALLRDLRVVEVE